jgi:hypothetical protein
MLAGNSGLVNSFFMNSRGRAFTYKLCGTVDPSVRKPELFSEIIEGRSFELRLVYIADDDLGFINQCTHQWDEFASNMHREPYQSVAISNSGQTFIVSIDHEAVCVAEVYHALQYYVGEEFMPKERDYFLRLFFSDQMPPALHTALLHFFTGYCSRFEEVGGLIIKADNLDNEVLVQSGFTAVEDAQGKKTGIYYYSTSKENV